MSDFKIGKVYDGAKKLRPLWLRCLVYVMGMLILAIGISLTTKLNLGVSPIISIAFATSEIFTINFATMAFVLYATFVLIQVVIHLVLKKYRLVVFDLSQMIINFIMTIFLAATGTLVGDLAQGALNGLFTNIFGRYLILFVSIILTGVGAAMSLNMRIVPNPGDGIVQILSDVSGKPLGLVKNIFDISCVIITVIGSWILVGDFIGLGPGTLFAMIGVGRVISIYQKLTENSWLLKAEVKPS